MCLVSCGRPCKRPGSYHVEKEVSYTKPEKCPFCEGHEKMTPPEVLAIRSQGSRQDKPGWKVRVVPNKYPALKMDLPLERSGIGIFNMMAGFGAHEVIVETIDHKKEAKDQEGDKKRGEDQEQGADKQPAEPNTPKEAKQWLSTVDEDAKEALKKTLKLKMFGKKRPDVDW